MIFVRFSGQFSLLGNQRPFDFCIGATTYSFPEFAGPTLVYMIFFERGIFREKKPLDRLFGCVFKNCLYLNRFKTSQASIQSQIKWLLQSIKPLLHAQNARIQLGSIAD